MRELVAEAQAARAKAAEAKAPRPAATQDDSPWPYLYVETPVCAHGRMIADPCHDCGRR